MGPHAVGDLVGLDVGVRAASQAPPGADPRDGALARRLVAEGRLGQKSGSGLYRYEPGSRQPVPDPAVQDMIREEARRLGVPQRPIDDEEIVQRCLLALINEGAALLGEGIALRASDIDTVWLHGYGFPRWKGGPMHHADQWGLPQVVEQLARWALRCPEDAALWRAAPLLQQLAELVDTQPANSVARVKLEQTRALFLQNARDACVDPDKDTRMRLYAAHYTIMENANALAQNYYDANQRDVQQETQAMASDMRLIGGSLPSTTRTRSTWVMFSALMRMDPS
jgi:3-hydroxyacyl-CoA dehydrogenase